MNTIAIIILTIMAWQLIYVIAVNLTNDNETVTSVIGGGFWLIPIIIINKIFYKQGLTNSLPHGIIKTRKAKRRKENEDIRTDNRQERRRQTGKTE